MAISKQDGKNSGRKVITLIAFVVLAVICFGSVARAQFGPPQPCIINPSLCGFVNPYDSRTSSANTYDPAAAERARIAAAQAELAFKLATVNLTIWTRSRTLSSKSASDMNVTATALLASVPSARARITTECIRHDENGSPIAASFADTTIAISGGQLYARVLNQPPPNTVSVNVYVGEQAPVSVEAKTSDSEHFSIKYPLRKTAGLQLDLEPIALEFNVNGKQVVLKYSEKQPVYTAFLNQCDTPSLSQASLIKEIAERDAAETAARRASAEHVEIERVAREKAAEEEARIRKEKEDADHAAYIEEKNQRRTAVLAKLGPPDGLVNEAALKAFLAEVAISPNVKIGQSARMSNDREWSAAVTEVFLDGSERYQLSKKPFGDLTADQYKFWNPSNYSFTGVEIKKDYLRLKIAMVLVPTARGDIKLMLGKDWQSTMTNQHLMEIFSKLFPVEWWFWRVA